MGLGPSVLAALGEEARPISAFAGSRAWMFGAACPEWSEHAPPSAAFDSWVEPEEARAPQPFARCQCGTEAESGGLRVCDFGRVPAERPGWRTELCLGGSRNGVGKTLGYIAPASVWAEKNEAPVWFRPIHWNLQHQIRSELDRLYPDPALKARRVVVRKGRENYLCLLNMEEALRGVAVRRHGCHQPGLMARWAARTRDGGPDRRRLSILAGRLARRTTDP